MCGICGEWNPAGVDPRALERMNGTIAHRGPDDAGAWIGGRRGEIGLAMRRLSIIDLAGGHQPMANEDGSARIVFNGEIYNHRELRRGLVERGHRFRSDSDTEVILHLWEERGEHVVDELRGMFAFAIWDDRRRRLLLARDRFGQKPLFYREPGRPGDRFLFGSEIKALLAAGDEVPPLDLEALDHYLALRFVPSPRTLFDGIRKLPPAHVLVLDAGDLDPQRPGDAAPAIRIERYWQLRYTPKRRISEREAVAETRERIADAVESHLISDVPVGAYLSGGMDSSLVVALMAQARERAGGGTFPTFAIGVDDAGFNELPWAKVVAEHCGTEHHEEIARPDMVRLLPTMIHHLDEPSDPIAACMFHSAALAARHVKVVLSGDGGDEIFAGYDRYFGYKWVGLYAALPEPLRRHLLGPGLRLLRDSAGYKNATQKLRWMHELSFHRGGRRFAQATAFFRFGEEGKGGLYSDGTRRRLAAADCDPMDAVAAAFDAAHADDDLDRMLHADSTTRLAEHSLMLTDRLTMAHSLEARSPLLDHRLAEHVASLPTSLKLHGRTLKYVLRKAAEGILPESILRRPKQGFMFPLAYWMHGPLVPMLRRLERDSVLVEAGIFRRDALSQLIREHLERRADHHVRLWLLLNVEVWYRMIHQRVDRDTLAEQLAAEAPAA